MAVDLEHPAILDAAMKPYACCRYIHPVIDACCRLHASAGFIPADVDRITVSVLPDGGPVIADPAALRESVDHETVSMLSSACITALH